MIRTHFVMNTIAAFLMGVGVTLALMAFIPPQPLHLRNFVMGAALLIGFVLLVSAWVSEVDVNTPDNEKREPETLL
jgi:hypothetical protein